MHVKDNIRQLVLQPNFFPYLIALLLSTIFVGYAPSSIVLGILGFTSVYYAIIKGDKIKISLTLILPMCLFGLFCLTYFWSQDASLTTKGIGRTITLFLMPLIFSIIPRFSQKKYKVVLDYFTISNVLYGLFFLLTAIFKFLKTGNITVFTYHDLVTVLDLNAIYVSVFFVVSVFYLLAKKNKSKIEKGYMIFLINMLFLLASKMVIAAFFLGLIIYALFFKGIKQLKNFKAVVLLIITLFVIGVSSRQVIKRITIEKTTSFNEVLHSEKFNRVYPWTGTSFRLLQLRILSNQINEDKIFWKGFGLFASRKNLKERHLVFNTYYGYHSYNYHNMYAQILAETGIISLLIIIIMLLYSLWLSIKLKNFLFIMFYVLFIMIFMTESFLWVHRGIFFFTIMYCLFNSSVSHVLKTQKN